MPNWNTDGSDFEPIDDELDYGLTPAADGFVWVPVFIALAGGRRPKGMLQQGDEVDVLVSKERSREERRQIAVQYLADRKLDTYAKVEAAPHARVRRAKAHG